MGTESMPDLHCWMWYVGTFEFQPELNIPYPETKIPDPETKTPDPETKTPAKIMKFRTASNMSAGYETGPPD